MPGRSSPRPRHSLTRRPYPRIIMTGQWAWRTTLSETLPISARLIPPRPLLPPTPDAVRSVRVFVEAAPALDAEAALSDVVSQQLARRLRYARPGCGVMLFDVEHDVETDLVH